MRAGYVALVIALSAGVARAQDTVASARTELDLSVPSSPAFAVLGLTPDTVTRPATPRAFAAALLNGVDENGVLQNGIAVDAAPYYITAGRQVTLQKYQQSPMTRFLMRLQFSAATAKAASGGDNAVRGSVGTRLTFWDRGDYHGNVAFQTALSDVFADASRQARDKGLAPSPTDPVKDEAYNQFVSAKMVELGNQVRERFRKASWNDSALSAGAALTWMSPSGAVTASTAQGGAFWASLAYGFENIPALENTAQFIVHARYRINDQIPKPATADQFYTQNSALVGARFRFGAPDTNASFETVYLHTDPDGWPRENYFRLSGDAEHRLVENIWLHISVGGETARKDERNHLFVLTNLKFAFDRKN
jgi:hypothetical protein